jgi:hypothetical protein
MAEDGFAGVGKLKVFISYSRKDALDFADELVAGLELAGFSPFLDRHDIEAGEDWEARLGGLILEADTVGFVVTPEAVKSERCQWEVDRTVTLGKRLLPVIWRAVSDTEIPKQLSRIQFVRFDLGPGIARPLAHLAEASRRDVDWIREHTRQAELAQRWVARGRPESLLLRGDTLDACKAWVERRRPDAPEITGLLRAFFAASEEAEAVHQRAQEELERLRVEKETREQREHLRSEEEARRALELRRITEESRACIGQADPLSDFTLDLRRHGAALPPEAGGLRRILESPTLHAILDEAHSRRLQLPPIGTLLKKESTLAAADLPSSLVDARGLRRKLRRYWNH